MTDLMGWLYDHYIHPQIENQPQDDADELHFAILESALMEAEKQDLEYVCRFYAVQGFRSGVVGRSQKQGARYSKNVRARGALAQ